MPVIWQIQDPNVNYPRWSLKCLRQSKRKCIRTNRVKQSSRQLKLNIVHHVSPTLNESSWTREYLNGQQKEDASVKVIIQFREESAVRPKLEDVSPYDSAGKTLWAQWDQLEFRDQVLFWRWKERKVVPEPSTRSSSQTTCKRRH